MLLSMTGYGSSRIEKDGKIIQVELRSLNSKSMDLSLRSVNLSAEQEWWVRNECTQQIVRGKVNLSLQVEDADRTSCPKKGVQVDLLALAGYVNLLKPFALSLDQNPENLLTSCLSLPGVVLSTQDELDEALWPIIQEALRDSLVDFLSFRRREGRSVQLELVERARLIFEHLSWVKQVAPKRQEQVRGKLMTALNEQANGVAIDQNRLEQEMIYYLDKLDYSEEIARLTEHYHYFLATLEEPVSAGKKLGFIVQEMGREINTIGSKANDAPIQQKVVAMKDELEKIKEQMANIL